jgi:poly-gamma-glutamate capsule biosynthesis protein CapA/YwtB (metallophosphatase superfamily)
MMKYFLKAIVVVVVAVSGKIQAQDTTRLSLLFIGDIMQHESQINAAYNPVTKRHEYDDQFQFVKPYFESVDYAIGNLELVLGGKPYTGYPQFSAPDALVIALKDAGIDVLVTANNHSADRRRKGIDRTIKILDSLNIAHTGTFRDSAERANTYPLMLSKNDFKIALLNYTYGTNGIPVTKPNIVNLLDTALIRKDIAHAKTLMPDYIIVFTHWGNEYQQQPSVAQKKLAEFCFNQGAQIVIGSHPHVIQPMAWRKDKNQVVVYSLGNFVSGQRDRYKNGGAMVRLEFSKIKHQETAQVNLDSAGYILEWVYKTADANRDFYILPVPTFENDTTGFIKDENSKQAFKTFIDDSRKLLNTYNVDMNEIKLQPFRKPDE